MGKRIAWFIVLVLSLFSSVFCQAEGLSWHAVGVRYGTNDGIDKKTDLRRYEMFGVFDLPWKWEPGRSVDLYTIFMASGGLLEGSGDEGFIGTLGAGFSLTDKNRRYFLELTGGIAVIPDYRLGHEDFGGPVQFTFAGGIGIQIWRNIILSYRIQHYSDASLWGSENRGVDWQLFEVGYRF